MNDLIAVENIAQRQKLKALVLDSVSSPITKRVYNMALEEFYGWFQQAPRRLRRWRAAGREGRLADAPGIRRRHWRSRHRVA